MSIVTTEESVYLNYVNGAWRKSSTGEVIPSYNPADINEIVGKVQSSSIADLDYAIQAAKSVQKSWGKLSGSERGEYLYKVAQILENRLDEIAETMTREMGKTLPEAKGETARGIAI